MREKIFKLAAISLKRIFIINEKTFYHPHITALSRCTPLSQASKNLLQKLSNAGRVFYCDALAQVIAISASCRAEFLMHAPSTPMKSAL